MIKIERSIEINVPVHQVYSALVRFNEFPRFMKGVHSVQQLDDTHLHWRAERAGEEMAWDAEITEKIPERCIAWRNINGPSSEGRVILEEIDHEKTRIKLSMVGDLSAVGHVVEQKNVMPHDEGDLARFKKMLESEQHAKPHNLAGSSQSQDLKK